MSMYEESADCMRMTGEQVSEAMLADVEKYFLGYFFKGSVPFYKNTFKILGATINEYFDDIEVKLLYCGCIEKRFVKIDELYKL